MRREEFIKEASKYSKDAILRAILGKYFINTEEFLRDLKWQHANSKFDKLMAQSEAIRKKIKPLIDKHDLDSHIKYMALLEEDNRIHKKIDAVMKEMDKQLAGD